MVLLLLEGRVHQFVNLLVGFLDFLSQDFFNFHEVFFHFGCLGLALIVVVLLNLDRRWSLVLLLWVLNDLLLDCERDDTPSNLDSFSVVLF
jgi:hypothetical protein